jgi:hypothetical protein
MKYITLEKGGRADYEALAHYHYRGGKLGPYVAIFKLTYKRFGRDIVAGVIVYTMPSMGLELRNLAFGDFFSGLDRRTRLSLINKNIRCISRVIIEPRFRSLGLAVKLVKETLSNLNVPVIEALAVMGHINPFFEKAGMTAYKAPIPERCIFLAEAFYSVGVEDYELVDPPLVQKRIDSLNLIAAGFLERQIQKFMQSYGKRRYMPAGIERTRFVLSKLTDRPVYYTWVNKKVGFRV